MIKDRGYETYKIKEFEKEHKNEPKEITAENTMSKELAENPQAPMFTYVNHILRSVYSIIVVYLDNHQVYISNRSFAYNS